MPNKNEMRSLFQNFKAVFVFSIINKKIMLVRNKSFEKINVIGADGQEGKCDVMEKALRLITH